MVPLFLFGTLRHPALLETVLEDTRHLSLRPARLPWYSVLAVAEGPFPMIAADPGAVADGLLVDGLTEHDRARLDFYEGAFEYRLSPVTLEDGQEAAAYVPTPGQWTPEGTWSLEHWARDWGALSVLAAEEAMSYFGQKAPAEVGQMFPMIRARAWSRLNAAKSLHGAGTMDGRVEIVDSRRVYAKFFALDEYDLRHERFDGRLTPEVSRAVFLAPDAALVLPYDPRRDRVLVVEQMRMGPLARGDRRTWQLEPIAGRLDPGETPEAAVRREAMEEAGLTLGALEPVAETYCSPGTSSEFYYIFVGLAELPDEVAGVGGLDAEDEDIRSHLLSFDQLLRMCDARQIANAPLLISTYWLAQHRARMRGAAGG